MFYLHHLRRLAGQEGCEVHAYCLMTNHVHLLLTPAREADALVVVVRAFENPSLPPMRGRIDPAADLVLPGAAYVEKDALYTNEQGLVQAVSQAIAPPGEALEDWEVLTRVAKSLGLALGHQQSRDVRRAIAAAMPDTPYADADKVAFARPVSARNWLQASNPSERWKWDFMYQDLAPVKGHNVQTEGLPPEIAFIPLKPVSK